MNLFDYKVEERELPPEQEDLLHFLTQYASYKPDKWIDPFVIQVQLKEYFAPTSENAHNDAGRARIRKAVHGLRRAGHLIVSSGSGYKMGNKEETVKFIDRSFNATLRKMKMLWAMREKVAQDGQMQFTNNGIEKVEAFVKEMRGE